MGSLPSTGYVTTCEVLWTRAYSAIPGAITFPAGTPVVREGESFWIAPCAMPKGSIERHDLTYYGCEVPADKVKEVKHE